MIARCRLRHAVITSTSLLLFIGQQRADAVKLYQVEDPRFTERNRIFLKDSTP